MAMDAGRGGQSFGSNDEHVGVKDITSQFDELLLNFGDAHTVQYSSLGSSPTSQQPAPPQESLLHNSSLPLQNNKQIINNDQSSAMEHTPDPSNLPLVNLMDSSQQQQQQQDNSETNNNILVVTNVDLAVYTDQATRQTFENIFLAFDSKIVFRYLKSFRRVRLDFSSHHSAAQARCALDRFKMGPNSSELRCYLAQIIKPPSSYNSQQASSDQRLVTSHLAVPKLTKQFLISPPASPPVDWQPVQENSPCIGVELISALANLVPGQVHEIHPASNANPGIFVEVCEEPQFESSMRSCSHIPRTMSPGRCR